MRVKTILTLCAASAVAGVALTPPAARKAKQQTGKAVKTGATKYVDARDKVSEKAGWPGRVVAATAKKAGSGASAVVGSWRGVVKEAEREKEIKQRQPDENGAQPLKIDELNATHT